MGWKSPVIPDLGESGVNGKAQLVVICGMFGCHIMKTIDFTSPNSLMDALTVAFLGF
jgi:hypothetical protein